MTAPDPVTDGPEFFRSLVESSPNGIVYVSLDGRLTYANPRARVLAQGNTGADVIGAAVQRFFAPEELGRARQDIETLRAAGVQRLAEYEISRVDGTSFAAEISASVLRDGSGAPTGYAALIRDITPIKALEQSFKLLFETNPLPMWVFDSRTLAFLEVNRAAVQQYGYSREEFLSMLITDIRPAEDVERLQSHLAAPRVALRHTADWRHRWKNGAVRDVEIFSHTLRFDGRNAVLVVVHDITEQRTLENQFRQAQKMEAVGRLAGGIAHDFNNLLTAILGYCEMLLEHPLLPPALRTDVQEIESAGKSAASLTRQLLAFSRKQIIDPKVIDVNIVLGRMVAMLRRVIGEHITLDFHRTPHVRPVLIDPGQLEQLLMNLAVNARDAMPHGGRLTIETSTVELDDAYAQQHLDAQPGTYVMLGVSDTGVGMTPEVQARLFEPFFTTKPAGQGTGLGLATVFGIVKQNGGNIWVYSEPGHGTTFKIYFPAIADGATAAVPPQPAGVTFGSETILVVEDDPRLRTLAQRALERFGYTVLLAGDGEHAVQIARLHKGPIHGLVTDVVLPSMSGRTLAREVAAMRPDIAILYVSGYTADTVVHHGVVDSGVEFLQKPFTPDSLARKVREVLDKFHSKP